jgi:hypothetical protein
MFAADGFLDRRAGACEDDSPVLRRENAIMNGPQPSLAQRIRVMQIVAGAITAGAVLCLAIMVFVVHNQGHGTAPPREGSPPLLSYLSLGLLIVQIPLALFVPAMVVRQGLERLAAGPPPTGPSGEDGSLLGLKQTAMIISLALLEGASFFASITYLVEAQPLSIGTSAAAILLLLANFPWEGRVTSWLEEQRRVVNELRLRRRSDPPA